MVIILYIVLILSGINIAKTAKEYAGTYLAIGITAIFFYHMVKIQG